MFTSILSHWYFNFKYVLKRNDGRQLFADSVRHTGVNLQFLVYRIHGVNLTCILRPSAVANAF